METWLKLQNGSDIRGVAIDGVQGENVNLTSFESMCIGYAFAKWLMTKDESIDCPKIAVGHDSRLSADSLKAGVISGIVQAGGEAIDCALATTPSLFMATQFDSINADGGIMITASHLPYNRNGLKFFTAEGGLDKPDIKTLLQLAESSSETLQLSDANGLSFDLIGAYSEHLRQLIKQGINHPTHYDLPLEGFKIIVDAGNGAGGYFATQVLEKLGADTSGSQFLNPDGHFPNHQPNPEDHEAMESIKEATVKAKADLGIIFDTDGDRSAVVLQDGSEINRNKLIALMSAIVLEEHPGTTIVTDSVTSDGLARFIQSLGGRHLRFKRGYKNVINESIRLNQTGVDSQLAIETSGHGALKENFFLDDGAYMAVKIIIQMAKARAKGLNLADLIKELDEPRESAEIRVKITYEDFKLIGEKIIEDMTASANFFSGWAPAPDNHEGIRFMCLDEKEQGWFLVRLSLHDPVIPINIESDTKGGVREIAMKVYSILDNYDHLDLSGFDKVFISKLS